MFWFVNFHSFTARSTDFNGDQRRRVVCNALFHFMFALLQMVILIDKHYYISMCDNQACKAYLLFDSPICSKLTGDRNNDMSINEKKHHPQLQLSQRLDHNIPFSQYPLPGLFVIYTDHKHPWLVANSLTDDTNDNACDQWFSIIISESILILSIYQSIFELTCSYFIWIDWNESYRFFVGLKHYLQFNHCSEW